VHLARARTHVRSDNPCQRAGVVAKALYNAGRCDAGPKQRTTVSAHQLRASGYFFSVALRVPSTARLWARIGTVLSARSCISPFNSSIMSSASAVSLAPAVPIISTIFLATSSLVAAGMYIGTNRMGAGGGLIGSSALWLSCSIGTGGLAACTFAPFVTAAVTTGGGAGTSFTRASGAARVRAWGVRRAWERVSFGDKFQRPQEQHGLPRWAFRSSARESSVV